MLRERIEYADVATGFEVIPTLTGGGGVILDIRAEAGAMSDAQRAGTIERRELVTSVYGKLGEWIDWAEQGKNGVSAAAVSFIPRGRGAPAPGGCT